MTQWKRIIGIDCGILHPELDSLVDTPVYPVPVLTIYQTRVRCTLPQWTPGTALLCSLQPVWSWYRLFCGLFFHLCSKIGSVLLGHRLNLLTADASSGPWHLFAASMISHVWGLYGAVGILYAQCHKEKGRCAHHAQGLLVLSHHSISKWVFASLWETRFEVCRCYRSPRYPVKIKESIYY